jgi:hypothetical protein
MNLAQRLNDLATANSKGIISDDEYRILRQDLFDRMTSSAPMQSESTSGSSRNSSYAPSTFHLSPDLLSSPNHARGHKNRTPSVTSKTSKNSNGKSSSVKSSGVSSFLFRSSSSAQKAGSSYEASNTQSPDRVRGHNRTRDSSSLYSGNLDSPEYTPTSSSPGSSSVHGHRHKRSALLRNQSGLSGSSTSLALDSDSGLDWDGEAGPHGHERKTSIMRLKANRSTPSMRRMPPPSSFYHVRDKSSQSQSSAHHQHTSSQSQDPPTSPT